MPEPPAEPDLPDRRDPPDGRPLAQAALARRRRRDAAAILPLAGLLLFVSPLLDVAARAAPLAGIPAAVLYLFGAWFALIALTAGLARRLKRGDAGGG